MSVWYRDGTLSIDLDRSFLPVPSAFADAMWRSSRDRIRSEVLTDLLNEIGEHMAHDNERRAASEER